jgi:hypothetical protein
MTAATSDAVTSRYAGRVIWGAFIGGAFIEAGDEETFAVTEPATGRPLVVGDGLNAASARRTSASRPAAAPCRSGRPETDRAARNGPRGPGQRAAPGRSPRVCRPVTW